ncbi:putative glycogen synthase 2 [Candidatus Rubidus massiliensis]|nr:MAG: glycogen synthase [Chlamydia sp. 32-24]CDZ80375.1 putative glycogen synthase 2 [Candidatus Rubidus massiliensis]
MYITHIAAEMAPIAKVGGLGDVILGLSREQKNLGHQVAIILPKYDGIDTDNIKDFTVFKNNILIDYQGQSHILTIWKGLVEGVTVYFIDSNDSRQFFHRGCFYGCEDDNERFLYFSKASLEFISQANLPTDIIHIHDWQTAAISFLLPALFKSLDVKTVFTIHNMEYQGNCGTWNLDALGLDGNYYLDKERLQDHTYSDSINLLKGAIIYANTITTVSPTYAKEVLTPYGGKGLDTTLKKYAFKFFGILNGIDTVYWNPETDPYLPTKFSSREIPLHTNDKIIFDNKGYIKRFLRKKSSLEEIHAPIVGCVTRLVPQKGIELIKQAIVRTLEKKGQFVLLGSSPIISIQEEFQQLKDYYRNNPNVCFFLSHNEPLAHLIYAGSDMFVIPSIFEPCGLTQMIALRYGSIPIVRNTGGLSDTIFDFDYSGLPLEQTNGFSFDYPDETGLNSALDRALDYWFKEPKTWRKLALQGMHCDFSWKCSAKKYIELYQKMNST